MFQMNLCNSCESIQVRNKCPLCHDDAVPLTHEQWWKVYGKEWWDESDEEYLHNAWHNTSHTPIGDVDTRRKETLYLTHVRPMGVNQYGERFLATLLYPGCPVPLSWFTQDAIHTWTLHAPTPASFKIVEYSIYGKVQITNVRRQK